MARMKASTRGYMPTPRPRRDNSRTGHYGVDLCQKWSGNGQTAGVPTSQVLVPVQIADVIDRLWLE